MSSATDSNCDETDVIICGGGPTGALLSALLGLLKVPNVVLEREAQITTDPRGIALDEDGIRMIQAIGAYESIYTKIGRCNTLHVFWQVPGLTVQAMGWLHFVSGTGHDLMKKPLTSVDLDTLIGPTAHVGYVTHKQPVLEQIIRDIIESCEASSFRSSCTLTGIEESDTEVMVSYDDGQGNSRSTRGKYLVGADGKTGFVRKKYLEPKGIEMLRCEGTNYDETWVALNWTMKLPTPQTHPNFPLWPLGYTPEQVFELFFPAHFRFLCNPSRPSVCGRFGPPEDRLWRFEFVVQKDEDPQKMATPEEARRIIFPYITHPGSRYGLTKPVQFPEDCIICLRSRPFSFLARSCNRWVDGRVILAGDAAHVFPPFGGQGIASGFRDVTGLAWRLAYLSQNPDIGHRPVLKAWYMERKQQLEHSLAKTVRNGEYVTMSDPIKSFIRDWKLWAVQLIPAWRLQLEEGDRTVPVKYSYELGLSFLGDMNGGALFPQVFVYEFDKQKVALSDDLVFDNDKKGLFQLVVLPKTTAEIPKLLNSLPPVAELSKGLVVADEITVLVQDETASPPISAQIDPDGRIARTATAVEFMADPVLSINRSWPRKYDPHRVHKTVEYNYAIVRLDRFIYASCSTVSDLEDSLRRLRPTLNGDTSSMAKI